jgi:hypothetical protein
VAPEGSGWRVHVVGSRGLRVMGAGILRVWLRFRVSCGFRAEV